MEIHSVGPFIIGKTLGQGTTGKVKLGFHKDTGFKVGIKIINKDLLNNKPSMRRKIEREVVLMKLIDHPNALKMYEVYETSNYLFLILEYVEGGELFDYLVEKGGLESGEALFFFQQIIAGLDYCHSRNICHRDLKPENLLLSGDKKIKICDFGMGSIIKKDSLLHTSCGSPHYASPEVVSGIDYDGQKTDVWSCGVILYALLTGRLPFDDDNIRRLLSKVKSGDFVMPAYIHKDAQDLLTKMLIVDPKKRISIKEVKRHPWFLSNTVQIQKSIPVDDISCSPLPDLASVDDEIFRSLMVLGLGSVDEVKRALINNDKSQILVYYRLLEERKKYDTEGNKYGVKVTKGNLNEKRRNSASELSLRRMFGKQKSTTDINSPTSPHGNNNNTSSNSSNLNNSNNSIPPPLNLSNSNNSISQQQSPRPQAASSEGLLKQALQQHHQQSQMNNYNNSNNNNNNSPVTITVSDKLPSIQNLNISNSPTNQPYNNHHHQQHPNAKNIVPPLSLSQAIPPPSTPKEPIQRRGSMTATTNPATSPTISHRGKTSSPIEITKVRKLKLQESTTPNSPIIGSSPKKSWFSYFFSKGGSSNNLKNVANNNNNNNNNSGSTSTTTTTTTAQPITPTLVVETRTDSSLIVVNLEKVFTKLGIEWKLKSNHSQISYSLRYPTSNTVNSNGGGSSVQDGAGGHSTLYECDIEVDRSNTNESLNRIYIVKKSGSNSFFSSLTNSIEQLFI